MSSSGQPERLFCSAGDCLEDAITHGQATFEVGAEARAAPDEQRQSFTLPLCLHHARLLGFGNTLVGFSVGLLEDMDGR
jgi:hypothetical protein